MNIVYNASAGTGKTYQVTKLYTDLVLGQHPEHDEPIDPHRILLITFTDAAAAELRARVSQNILKARNQPDQFETVNTIYKRLSGAPISTIHAFCTRLLRENALACGLSPRFSVIEDEERTEILHDVTRNELLKRLGDPKHLHFQEACQGIDLSTEPYGLYAALSSLVSQAAGKGASLNDAVAQLPDPELTVGVADFADIRNQLAAAPKLPAKATQVFQALENLLQKFPIIGKNSPDFSNDWKNFGAFFQSLEKTNLGGFTGTGMKPISDQFKALKETAKRELGYFDGFDMVKAYGDFAAAVATAFADEKKRMDVIDFDDQLLKARDLLMSNPAFSELFDYIIVDEVQDTSRIQCDLIHALWRLGENQLVICGDKKQSIYAWRNADPKVMDDLQSHITAGEGKIENLSISRRSKDAIIDFANSLFPSLINYTNAKLDVDHDRGAATREHGEQACVEWLRAAWEGLDKTAAAKWAHLTGKQRLEQEVEAVAKRIRLLVDGDATWRPAFRFDDTTNRFAPVSPDNEYRYADILILLNRSSNQAYLEAALRKHNVPYVLTTRSKGLFTRQEVKDLYLFLKVLVNPGDAVALMGFLRSPLCGCSDEMLMNLGWNGENFTSQTLINSLMQPPKAPELDLGFIETDVLEEKRLQGIRRQLERYQELCEFELPSNLVREIIRETGYDALLCGLERGEQRLANMKAFIDWLRKNEHGGRQRLPDVVRLLEEHLDNPPPEPEAAMLDPDQNAVRIMTVHGSKGLTSRVVFIPEIDFRPPNDSDWNVLADYEDSVRLEAKLRDANYAEVRTPGFDDARNNRKSIRTEESLNLFYVAVTRARDLLVFSGPDNPTMGNNRGWRKHLVDFSSAQPDSPLLKSRPYQEMADAFSDNLNEHDNTSPELRTPEEIEQVIQSVQPLTIPDTVLRYPVTTLTACHRDPEQFKKRTLVRLDAIHYGRQETTDNESSVDDALTREAPRSDTALGTLGHEILEQLALINWQKAPDYFKSLTEGYPELINRIQPAYDLLKEHYVDATTMKPEWPFAVALDQDGTPLIIDGTMDLVMKTTDKNWHVIDYKFTNDNEEKLIHKYQLQMNIYQYALAQFSDQKPANITASLLAISDTTVQMIEVDYQPIFKDACFDTAELLRMI